LRSILQLCYPFKNAVVCSENEFTDWQGDEHRRIRGTCNESECKLLPPNGANISCGWRKTKVREQMIRT
jgi:hypothetical protein